MHRIGCYQDSLFGTEAPTYENPKSESTTSEGKRKSEGSARERTEVGSGWVFLDLSRRLSHHLAYTYATKKQTTAKCIDRH